ncbi:hypothetical protein [Herbaspirillum sp. ST 5-3]|uniref:hypothetical protein n=1 Tax=Oxalobacteraceae TaxID=75682 RepID=UPI001B3BA810|nr:hypothetical protein [Herbaspirillum sp. ST 5-3]
MNILKIILIYFAAVSAAFAHGPDGDHSHEDATAPQVQAGATPRIEASTESFELVGQLHKGELSILIDRYETNEPVLGGKLEVESNGLKAQAKFHSDYGDYSVDDKQMLEALAKPGKHPLVFTLTTANESDLLEGALEVRDEAHADNHSRFPWAWTGAGLLAALLAFVLAAKIRRPKTSMGKK